MSGLTPIDAAALPADIRNGPASRKATYEGAMQFEQMLVEQLTSQLTADAKSNNDSDSSDDASGDTSGLGGPYGSMLPQAMAKGIESGGGLGLARQLTNSIDPVPVTTLSAPNPPSAAS